MGRRKMPPCMVPAVHVREWARQLEGEAVTGPDSWWRIRWVHAGLFGESIGVPLVLGPRAWQPLDVWVRPPADALGYYLMPVDRDEDGGFRAMRPMPPRGYTAYMHVDMTAKPQRWE